MRSLYFVVASAGFSLGAPAAAPSYVAAQVPAANPPAANPVPAAPPAAAPRKTEPDAERRLVFRLEAPKAAEVTASGDFGPAVKLAKDERGIWTGATEPLTPDFYSYRFEVDGLRIVDPRNPLLKPGLNSNDSLILVPGPEAEFETTNDVPHGDLRAVWYRSETVGTQRRMHVYTPPGYDAAADQRYPVLYLLHGSGDDDAGWSTVGRAGYILDNLIAAQKAVPMLVVMPNGSLPPPPNAAPLARPAPGAPPTPEMIAARERMQNRFTDELLKEIVPFVEKSFRVKAEPAGRALAGLSMGGVQTTHVLTTHPDQFAYVGVWSAGLFGANPSQWEERNEKFLSAAEQHNGAIKRLEIVVGEKDFALAGSKSLTEVLQKRGVKHELRLTGGGHTWINWRQYLHALGPKLFQ